MINIQHGQLMRSFLTSLRPSQNRLWHSKTYVRDITIYSVSYTFVNMRKLSVDVFRVSLVILNYIGTA